MKLTLITRHFFSSYNRKTTVHFIAREFAKRGYTVNFVSVGRSVASTINKDKYKGIPKDISRKKFSEIEPNIFSIVLPEWVHPISSKSDVISLLTSPILLGYGKSLPEIVKQSVIDSDVVLIECGYGVAYFDFLKKICNKAKFIYFATDPLTQVGLRKEFEKIEMNAITKFDLVRVASKDLGDRFPKQTNLVVIPQGLDKSVFDKSLISPYKQNTKNFISIGDMSFDYNSIIIMAQLMPNIDFHIFGADIPVEYPNNITIHGEIDFIKLVPYIKFADVGIMPYKMDSNMAYLTKTSLKFLQYSYSGLPIVTPNGPDWERDNVFQYEVSNEASINSSLENAIRATKDLTLGNGIFDWSDCTQKLISSLNTAAN